MMKRKQFRFGGRLRSKLLVFDIVNGFLKSMP